MALVASVRSQALTADYISAQDCVVIVADHDAIDWALVGANATTVVDTRNTFKRVSSPFTAQLAAGAAWPTGGAAEAPARISEARPGVP